MVSARVRDKESWRRWRKMNERLVAECLAYSQQEGMPSASSLISAHFHPELPLIGLNYTGAAHNTLHAHPDGWTLPLRYCRGIVFNRRGMLLALPFPKFFNYGEHPETRGQLSSGFEATEKHDGHLGIIFRYRERFILTTRGTFTHRTAELGNQMLDRIVRENNWAQSCPRNLTLLVEVIHPETRVHADYGERTDLILIGACDTRILRDFEHTHLVNFAQRLGLPHTNLQGFRSIVELHEHVQDTSISDREGFVARFPDGRRIKFKFGGYLGRMFAAKLSFKYVLQRLMAGDLDDRLAMLPPEDAELARQYMAQALSAQAWQGTQKERWTRLYGFLSSQDDTPHARAICRDFIKWLDSGGLD
jgi:RNA ligase